MSFFRMIARGEEVMLKPGTNHPFADKVFVIESVDWRLRGRNNPKPYLCRVKDGWKRLRFKCDDLMPAAQVQLIRATKGV